MRGRDVTEMPMTTPRPLTIEDVHKLIGALTLELDQVRRENALLREALMRNGQPEVASPASGAP
jgi:hypothetical protein